MRIDAAAFLLRKCANIKALLEGKRIHAQLSKAGLDQNTFLGNLLLHMYGNCGELQDARETFNNIQQHNVFSWTIMIRAYAQNGHLEEGRSMFDRMPQWNVVTWNAMMAAYAQTGHLQEAQGMFHRMPRRDVVSWNAIIAAYAQNGYCREAIGFFQLMDLEGVQPDNVTFVSVLGALSELGALVEARLIHVDVVARGFHSDIVVGTALLTVFGRCGNLEEAKSSYDQISGRNCVSWNALIAAYAQNGHSHEARITFDNMPQRDAVSWTTILGAYARNRQLQEAKSMFDRMPQRDLAAWNAIVAAYAQNEHMQEAGDIFDKVPHRDVVSWTSMIILHAQNGDIEGARSMFDQTFQRDVTLWNAMITAYAHHGHFKEALELFHAMDTQPDRITYQIIVDACVNLADLGECRKVDASVTTSGLHSDVALATARVRMYGRCGALEDAKFIFDKMDKRNVGLWNATIAVFMQNGYLEDAKCMFDSIPRHDTVSWNIMIGAYAQQGSMAYARSMFDRMPEPSLVSYNLIISAYAQNGNLQDARSIFDRMPGRDVGAWNTMIAASAQHGHGKEALQLFQEMDIEPDKTTCIAVLDACASLADLHECRLVHARTVDIGHNLDLAVANCLVSTYGKCKSVVDAKSSFDRMIERNVVSFNCMICTYAQNGYFVEAKSLFDTMPVRDVVSWNTLAAAYAQKGYAEEVKFMFEKMPCCDGISWNVMIAASAQNGHLEEARDMFHRTIQPNVVSWNAMISVYTQNGHAQEALQLFRLMDLEGVQPDKVSFISVLDGCSRLTALVEGKLIHASIMESRFQSDLMLGNALVNFYGKCASLQEAQATFDRLPQQDVVSWNGIIAAYTQNGHVKQAFGLLWTMTLQGMKPDEITFVNILFACSHAGNLADGRHKFETLVEDYCIQPTLDHYMCMVDLLSRAGRLKDTEDLIENMPFEPDVIAWMTFLGACNIHGDVQFGSRIAREVVEMDPKNASPYVLLSNIYGAAKENLSTSCLTSALVLFHPVDR